MTRGVAAALLGLAAACSQLSESSGGVATLDVRLPANSFLEQERPLRLTAVARNRTGDSVDAVITWRTPDTTITVDSATGVVTALFPTGTGRVQVAIVGGDPFATNLENLLFRLTKAADTVILTGADSLEAPKDSVGARITGLVLQGGTPLEAVAGRPITFRIIEPAPVDSPNVVLSSPTTARVQDSTVTDATGSSPAMTVIGARNRIPPDRVVVEVNAYRASGDLIPGSGRRFVIRFRHE